ncbi:MAG: DUF512 domain-containing protein [Candidatus Saccharibacteria bacterium]
MKFDGAKVAAVEKGSIAEEIGIESGDRIVSINGTPVLDILDYQFLCSDEEIEINIVKPSGEQWLAEIERDMSESLGIIFDDVVFDRIRPCRNKCLFCFVDQLPRGMRKTLHVKDDDYRLSFLYGNFITLTNLSKQDWAKILGMRLSPIYVSVHSTNPETRSRLLGSKKAGSIMRDLQILKDHEIEVHTQIVLCPGINDGDDLAQTIDELASLWPSVQSVGIVPVGLTGHRDKLADIPPVDIEHAQSITMDGHGWQKRFRNEFGLGFVYLADEFYVKTAQVFPDAGYYDDYPQLENGIGLARLFLDDYYDLEPSFPVWHKEMEPIYTVCGYSAIPVLQEISAGLKNHGVDLRVIPVKNNCFGTQVTVTGLVTGRDIAETLGSAYKGKPVIVPEIMLKDATDLFLDNVTVNEIAKLSGARLRVVEMGAGALLAAIKDIINDKEKGGAEHV